MSRFFNYNREGKGVSKADIAAESPIKRIWTEYLHRFWQLVLLNVLYLLACVPLITIGPATAALCYVFRNMTQARPVDFFWDFIEKCKEHFKQGVIVSVIQLLVAVVLVVSFSMWTSPNFGASEGMRTFAVILIFCVGYLFFFGSFYLYPMMSSFDLSVKQLFRNSMILALTQLWRNLLILLTGVVFVVLTFLLWPLTFPVPLFIAFSTLFYVAVALVFPVLMKHVAVPDEAPPAVAEETEEDLFVE